MAGAQVLARPGWAGSGVAPEAWWLRAVFYRLDPARFQDSDGDGRGDLPGVVQRLDYLQALGVDALLLDSAPDEKDADALGDLVREASRHQLRVLVTASPDLVSGPQDALVSRVRSWLGSGVAGIAVPKTGIASGSDSNYVLAVSALRSVVQGFPGERVLLTDPAPIALNLAPRPLQMARHIDPDSFHAARSGMLVTAALFAVNHPEVTQLRGSLTSAAEQDLPFREGLLRFLTPPDPDSPDARAAGALLLGSRGAVVIDFGEELGLNLYPAQQAGASDGSGPIMQWTPSNHTAPAADPAARSNQKPATEFGAYHPYVPPPKSLTGPAAAPVRVAPDMNIPAALPDADTLPGFTSATLPVPPVNGATLNAITEDRDSRSLLNAYRQLIALHHGNPTLHNGTQSVMNHDAENALVWVRHAPPNSRTAANVLSAVNLSEQPVTLDLDADLEGLGMRQGGLRTLFSSIPQATTGESTERLVLPPHAAVMCELTRGGGRTEAAPRARRGGRRSRHRVRR